MKNINAKAAKAVRKRTNAKPRKYEGALFSVDSAVYKKFKQVCDKEQVKYSAAVEEFMKFYVETSKG